MNGHRTLLNYWFALYHHDHGNSAHRQLAAVIGPMWLWSGFALLWCIPPVLPGLQNGIWSVLAMYALWSYCNYLSRALGIGMLLGLFIGACLCRLLEDRWGLAALGYAAFGLALTSGIADRLGYLLETHCPAWPGRLHHVVMGALWHLAKLYRSLGWHY